MLNIRISDKIYKCPLLWVDDIFHQTAITHYFQHGVEKISVGPWPSIMTDFYNFVFSVSVTIEDIKLQFHVVEKIKIQSIKMTNWVLVNGAHRRDIDVDVEFCNFLESIELYQYLPNHPKNPKNMAAKEEPNFEDEMATICKKLDAVIRSNTELDGGIKELLLKYIEKGDLCTFILAVVNAQNIPCAIELAVIELLKSQLNLSDITNLTDLTGNAIDKTAKKNSSVEPSSLSSLNEALSIMTPSTKPLDDRVKNFIINEPIKVVELLSEIQKSDKVLTLDVLSDLILEHLNLQAISMTPPLQRNMASPVRTPSPLLSSPRSIASPQQFPGYLPPGSGATISPTVVPPGYNPRYYTPNLGPQHQQRYGRPPLRRNAVIQQGNAVRPNTGLHVTPAPRYALTPPTPQIPMPLPPHAPHQSVQPPHVVLRINLADKSVQVSPSTVDKQQQIELDDNDKATSSYTNTSDTKTDNDKATSSYTNTSDTKADKFVDLNFCPHV